MAWPPKVDRGVFSERGLDNRGVEADLLGNRMHKWFDGMRYSSARAPFYLTSAGYGIYVQSLWKGRYQLAVDQQTNFEFDDSELTYFVIYGPSYEHILSRYNALAGPSRMPPDWALGPIWWRDDSRRGSESSRGRPLSTRSRRSCWATLRECNGGNPGVGYVAGQAVRSPRPRLRLGRHGKRACFRFGSGFPIRPG